ncbi:CD109 antigen-like isoform X2 [Centruroides sculpturatus]|nr:CD109 antigen-like isoform X2 [Centruroides sculpturatus]XP_023225703.1 CD109 antigen-like isoform X2 [Centruroides sculpturatus]
MVIRQIYVTLIYFFIHGIVSQSVIQELNSYAVIAPKKLRPNFHYHVSVSIYDVLAEVDVTVSVEGLTEAVSKQLVLHARETEIVELEIGDWKPGLYNLTVEGHGGANFHNHTQLIYEHKSYSVFIQTDKAVYKPGQLVQFRAIVVDPYLIPSVLGTIDMHVRDSHMNKIHQWRNVPISRGIAAADFLLADDPNLGDWTVHVDVKGQNFSKPFTVAEYSLPTFEVHIDLPSYATYNESDIVCTIKAMYTYGKPVRGDVTLTVAPRTRYNYLSVRPYESTQVKAKINGLIDISMNLLRDLQLKTDFFEREIEFFALVEEEITGRKYNKTNTMWIYDKDVKVQLIKTSDTFKSGLKFTAFLKVTHQDGTLVVGGDRSLKLTFGYTHIEKDWKSSYYTLPENGLLKLEFYPLHEELNILYMRVEFRGQTHYIDGIDSAVSPSNNFIQVTPLTTSIRVGNNVEFEVNATEPMSHLTYQVMGRGSMVLARTIPVPNEKVYRFSFRVSSQMAPKARVIVYYVRNTNKEIVADAVNFEVQGVFRTQVNIRSNFKEVQPDTTVEIRVETRPNALIGILAIDKESILLKSGNDISQNDVIKELETYDGGKEHKYWPPWNQRKRKKRSLWWLGSTSAAEIFEDSGVQVLTDGLIYRFPKDDRYRENVIYIDDRTLNVPVQPPSALPDAPLEKQHVVLRKLYPDTWLWMNATAGNDGVAVISHSVPKALTTWVISAFSMSSTNGLGIQDTSAEIKVSQQFFIKMSLPYTVLKGESVAIQVVVFNYNSRPVKAEVTMVNSKNEYEFTIAGGDKVEYQDKRERSKFVTIAPNEGTPVSFLITPKKVGYIDIRVVANTDRASDAITKRLHVKLEGSTQYFNKAMFVDFSSLGTEPVKDNISIPIPYNSIEGSQRITISGVGDILGVAINNMEQILRLPYGCGEQNMLTFASNVIITNYLIRSQRLTNSIKDKAIRFLRFGYQRQLTYKRDDGSFSGFGQKDRSGSIWLTALVTKYFYAARTLIDIDEDVIEKAMQWLVQNRNSDNSFEEIGEIHHRPMQENKNALSAFVLISLLQNGAEQNYSTVIKDIGNYLGEQVHSSRDSYTMNIINYALSLQGDPRHANVVENGINKMDGLVKKSDKGDKSYWTDSEEKINVTDKQSDYFYLQHSQDIEMTAYALLVYSRKGEFNKAIPVLKWLVSSQNEIGGFTSTQDSIVALQALAEVGSIMSSTATSINAKFNYGDERSKNIRINEQNIMNLQRIDLPAETEYTEIEVTGVGMGVIQVSWSFNLAVSGETPAFFLNALLDKTSTESYLQLSICTHYKVGVSNMAVMEVGLPSGYEADTDALPSILQIPRVKKVEANQGNTNVVIYFDRLTREEACVTVPAHRTHKVAHQRPVPVKIYDYYNLVKCARMFYHPHKATLCDICDRDDCREGCKKEEKKDYSKLEGDEKYTGGGSVLRLCVLLMVGLLTFTLRIGNLMQ